LYSKDELRSYEFGTTSGRVTTTEVIQNLNTVNLNDESKVEKIDI